MGGSKPAGGARPFWEITDDGLLVWNGNKFQRQAWESLADEIWLLGGWRGGKTGALTKWLFDEMARCGPWGNQASYAMLAPQLRVAEDGMVKAWKDVFVDALQFFTYNSRDYAFYSTAQGEAALWGHRQRVPTHIKVCYAENPRSFAAGTFVTGICDEIGMPEFPSEAYTTFKARMMTFKGREAPNNPPRFKGMRMGRVMNGTTIYNLGWVRKVYEEYRAAYRLARARMVAECAGLGPEDAAARRDLFDRRARLGRVHPFLQFISFPSTANPSVPPEVIESFRARLPQWLFEMRFLARFTKPSGVIFDEWEERRHVVEPFHIPSAWERWWSIDFGARNFYALLLAKDAERGRAFVTASYHRDDLADYQHAQKLTAFCPSARRAVAGNMGEESHRVQLAMGGLPAMPPPYASLWQGIGDLGAAIKQGRFFVFKDVPLHALDERARGDYPDELPQGFAVGAAGLADQLGVYARPINPDTGEVILDALPVAKDTMHWVDAARYFATHNFTGLHGGVMAGGSAVAPEGGGDEPVRRQKVTRRAGEGFSLSLPAMFRAQRYGLDEGCLDPPLEKFF